MRSSRLPLPARALAPLTLLLALLACTPAAALADGWTATGSLLEGHNAAVLVPLANGRVLIAGGINSLGITLGTSQVWEPASGLWFGAPPMTATRWGMGASRLPDGRVLVTGGDNNDGVNVTLASTETYDPATSSWTGSGSMVSPHEAHAQVTLHDGRVAVFGGYDAAADSLDDDATDAVDLFDPARNAWSRGDRMLHGAAHLTATVLPDGRVLTAGGSNTPAAGGVRNVADLYDPVTNRWSNAGLLVAARKYHTATLLPNGKVLVAGGEDDSGTPLRTAELYDPATNRWDSTGAMGIARTYHTATLLPNGKVLVAGGTGPSGPLAATELYDPATGSWSPGPTMLASRSHHGAALLSDGRVLVASGTTNGQRGPVASAEIYTPDPPAGGGGSGGGPGTGGGSGNAGGGTGGATPSISGAALSATRFRAASSGPSATSARKRRAPVGTTISYRDSRAATATFVVQRPASGRRSGSRCVRPTRANRRHRRCTRWVTVGRFTHADAAGANSVRFSGRVAGHQLHPGRYRLSITARIGRGRASKARTVPFQIVR